MSEEGKRGAAAWPKQPRPSSTLLNLGRSLFAQKRTIEAAEAIRRALTLMPDLKGQTKIREENLRKLHEAIKAVLAETRTNGDAFVLKAEQIRVWHRIAMQDLIPNPGEYRKRSVLIDISSRSPPNWNLVPALMEDMCHYVNTNWTLRDPIHLGAFVLWHLNWIHPFGDGNGRSARAACYAILCMKSASSLPAINFLGEAHPETRTAYDDYISCLRLAYDTYSKTQNIDPATQHVEQWISSYGQ